MISFDQLRPTPGTVFRLLVSFGVALLLWGWVTRIEDPDETRRFGNIPVQIADLPEDLVPLTRPEPVQVSLTGPSSSVEGVSANDITVAANTEDVQEPGEYTLPLRVSTSADVRSRRVDPGEVTVRIDRLVSRQMPIDFAEPELDRGQQRIGALVPETLEVTVSGPESLVNSVATVEVRIAVGDATDDFSRSFQAVPLDANGRVVNNVQVSPTAVNVTVPIDTRGKEVPVFLNVTGAPAEGFELGQQTVTPATVFLIGPQPVLDTIFSVETNPIDVTGATETVTQSIQLATLPPGVSVLPPDDVGVQAVIEVQQRTFAQPLPNQAITVVGLGAGLVASVLPETATIAVEASQEAINALGAGAIQVQVDVTGLGPGTYNLEPRVLLPSGIRWTAVDPPTIEVRITEGSPGSGAPAAAPAASPPS
ncbi:MAG: hypothetical protein AVDCRST_MAG49-2457 [uncultured Thermomicrobiales bacterium]|uniref:Secreted protein associated with spyDAC n=1 Tax=uncultured Thermomicrobiales bacterium TaxID=1645740 RepID=A0A6J4UUX9_9BACT|nr:MAG: hypothetical protein AVDCRST_MAG49-2457 [uncultured Thermomicrobiales bacterium]